MLKAADGACNLLSAAHTERQLLVLSFFWKARSWCVHFQFKVLTFRLLKWRVCARSFVCKSRSFPFYSSVFWFT